MKCLYLQKIPFALLLGAAFMTGCHDVDGDGYSGPLDCDPFDESIHPGAVEVCDGIDQDCDGDIDEGVQLVFFFDADGDGYGDPEHTETACAPSSCFVDNDLDCDDLDQGINPDVPESCDGLDNDCDGIADEGIAPYYADNDGDRFGDDALPSCESLPGYVPAHGDCDDGDSAVHPGALDPAGDGVDQDCGGSENQEPHVGLSDTSLPTLQEALAMASPGDVIWVGPGVYEEHDLSFNGVAASLRSTQGADATIIDANEEGRVFIFDQGEGPDTLLEGFTLTHGRELMGGGILVDGASPTFDRLEIIDNTSASGDSFPGDGGGGMAVLGGHVVLRNSLVADNSNFGGSNGGGLYIESSEVTLYNVILDANTGYGRSAGAKVLSSTLTLAYTTFQNHYLAGGFGAALYIEVSTLTMRDSAFFDNWAEGSGGAVMMGGGSATIVRSRFEGNGVGVGSGGALVVGGATVNIAHSVFRGNWGSVAGALEAYNAEMDIEDTIFEDNSAYYSTGAGALLANSTILNMRHCIVADNKAWGSGGGISLVDSSGVIENSKFINNMSLNGTASTGGGGISIEDSSPIIRYCVFTGNSSFETDYSGAGGGIRVQGESSNPFILFSVLAYNDEYNLYNDPDNPGNPTLLYSDLYSLPAHPNHNLGLLPVSNLTVEPGFLEYTNGLPSEWHLASNSPLVNAASPALEDPDGSRADMGAYGGEGGDGWNLDGDCYPDYFWPGTLNDAPPGFSPADYDGADLDPGVH